MQQQVQNPFRHPLPAHAVGRPHLERRLDRVARGGLGLVIAPAGSGKSVLVRQWAGNRAGVPTAALGLTPMHDDATLLARDLVTAIRAVDPAMPVETADLVGGGGSTLGMPFVEAVLDELTGVAEDVVLVLEDLHALSNRAVVDDLGELLTRLPQTARCLVTSRREPPWTLRRLRLEMRLVELRGTDLAFTTDQARQLLLAVSERELSDHDVAVLTERTDGWAVGLQLAGISLRHRPDVAPAIDSFAGSDRLIAEYLLEEVLEQQEPETRAFLLQTSVLDWLSVELCDAVTGSGNARTMLAELEERSLFVIPLDMSRTRFRYQHLFAELLRYQLTFEEPDAPPRLHLRAAHWLQSHGRDQESIEHLLRAGEHERAFAEISRLGHHFFERGESATLVRWLTAIDAADHAAPPAVGVSLLAAQVAADLPDQALGTHRRLMRRPDLTPGARATADALHTTLVFRSMPPEAVVATARTVLDMLPTLEDDDVVDFLGMGGIESMRVMVEYDAAVAQFLRGDVERATTDLRRALGLHGAQYPIWRFYVLGSLALLRAWSGYCTEALQLADSALTAAEAMGAGRHPAVIHAHLASALAHLDRDDLEAAARHLDEADLQNRRRPSTAVNHDLHRAMAARLSAQRGEPAEAQTALRRPAASAVEPPVLAQANRALLARLLIASGEVMEARAVLDHAGAGPAPAAARVDLALATGDLAPAEAGLAAQPDTDDRRAVVGHRLRRAVVLDARGDRSGAEVEARRAVATAEDERLCWPFVEVPGAIRLLQRAAGGRTGLTGGLRDLSDRLAPEPSARGGKRMPGVIEPLTERELAVLAYLPRRMKQRDIAAELFITMNTLKTHLASIYRKLGVTDRDEAATRAAELGLL